MGRDQGAHEVVEVSHAPIPVDLAVFRAAAISASVAGGAPGVGGGGVGSTGAGVGTGAGTLASSFAGSGAGVGAGPFFPMKTKITISAITTIAATAPPTMKSFFLSPSSGFASRTDLNIPALSSALVGT